MDNPIVKVHQGELRGVCEKNIYGTSFVAFRGVPYAKPPVGNLRFKDSEPPEPWLGIKDATKFGDRCAQQDYFTRGVVGSDDCLNLNIYTPNLKPSVPKAVMVWIHGGLFSNGSNRDDLYGPDYLIDKGIVLVTINYRLGVLGFLNIGNEEAPGNQGLKDQVQALRWIQQNILAFGGNSNNVTICGDSAGGACVHYLTLSPLAQGLFHKAIFQSGVAINPWARIANAPIVAVKRLAAKLKINITNTDEFVKYLRTLDNHRLIEAAMNLQTKEDKIHVNHPFVPSIDSGAKNSFMPISIEEAAKAGIPVPCLCGYVSHDGMIVAGDLSKELFSEINSDPDNLLVHPTTMQFLEKHNLTIDDVKQFYIGDERISYENIEKLIHLLTDIHFVMGIHHTIEIQTQFPDIPLYFYKFDYESEISLVKKFLGLNVKGTCHTDEMSFLFYQKIGKLVGKKVPKPGSVEHLLIQRFTGLWTNFAKTGNPTPQTTYQIPIEWEPVDSSDEYKCLRITRKLNMAMEKNVTRKLCEHLRQ